MASDSGFCTSEEDDPRPLTRAEKAARTRALKAEAEHARNEALMAETADGRSAKKKALTKKVWVSKPGRKRGASTVAEERPEKAKKSKAAAAPNQSSDDDGMYEEPPVAVQKEKPRKKSVSVSALPTQTKRKYLPKSIALDDDSDIEPDVVKPRKSTSRASLRILSDTEENEPAPKARSKARSATDEADDTSQSADEEKSVDGSAISGEDDGLGGGSDEVQRQLLAERPHIMKKASAAGDYDPAHLPKLYSHHRKSSTSSRGSSRGGSEFNHPEDTDPDDNDLARPEDLDDEDEDRPVQLKASVPSSSFGKGQKKSAQQEKYDAEQPKIRQTKSRSRDPEAETTTEDIVLNEIEWHQDCRLRWPPNRGPLKLLDQTPIVQDVIRDAIEIGIREIATDAAYRPVPLRSVAAQELIGRAAKNLGERGRLVARRAKNDLQFCKFLAPLS